MFIDEVQKAPEILSLMHSIIEEKKGYQFILTGSSSRKHKRSASNLLAGRALFCMMFPFIASELGLDFDIKRALQIGMLPLVIEAANPEATLVTYISLYLKEEVQEEGLVRHVGDFARFLEKISFSHASLINTSNIARECDIARKTVENYIFILQDLLLAFTLDVFTKRAKRGLEVDFIVYEPRGFWAIELKFSDKIHPHDLHSLNSFCEDYPECQPMLLYIGNKKILHKNIMCIPAEDFLKNLRIDTLLY